MPNRPRPRCGKCDLAMAPVFQKGPRGKAFVKVPTLFRCRTHGEAATGRGGRSRNLGVV